MDIVHHFELILLTSFLTLYRSLEGIVFFLAYSLSIFSLALDREGMISSSLLTADSTIR